MWIRAKYYERLLDDNNSELALTSELYKELSATAATIDALRAQKVKDDITIDWMRHRINALEKERAILLNKVAGIHVPVPEIVPTRPGSLSPDLPDFDTLPSFEDVGDREAARLGIKHAEDGSLKYTN